MKPVTMRFSNSQKSPSAVATLTHIITQSLYIHGTFIHVRKLVIMADLFGEEEEKDQAETLAMEGYDLEHQQQALDDEENDLNEMQQNGDEDEEEEDFLEMGGDDFVVQEDALLMRFCPHDSSMLYPQVRRRDLRWHLVIAVGTRSSGRNI